MMRIGVPREVKNNEFRVALTPAGVHELVQQGHQITVEQAAGEGSGISDADYREAGAEIVTSAESAWGAELVLKVKEPIPEEYRYLREHLTLFTYLHLAADRALTDALLHSGATALAYETVERDDHSLPLLAPMSEIAGSLAPQAGAHHLRKPLGGSGVLLGGIAGVASAAVGVLGGGVAGLAAARVARGMGADVTVFDVNHARMRYIEEISAGAIRTQFSTALDIAQFLPRADLVIGAALVPGAKAPRLITDAMVATMRPGSVLVDIAIDQGGCFEGSRPTTHADPVFTVHDSIFYCVANMPGAVPMTSTRALTNSTLPYVHTIAAHGWLEAARQRTDLARSLATHEGALFSAPVAEAFGLETRKVSTLFPDG